MASWLKNWLSTTTAMSDVVIGIDLGTTNTCAAYYINGQVKVLINEEGGRVTPSFIFVTTENNIVIGQYAKKMAEAKPQNGICEIKRLVGRKFDDPYLQNNLQYFPFVIENANNEPIVSIERKDGKFRRTPEELYTAILVKVKKDIGAKVGKPVDKAVITVPAYFNIRQREVTLSAANKAGFKLLKLLNEPTASALTYYLEDDYEEENYSLVYDLGGGTFDVAILKRNGSNIDIIGVDGNTHLGGHDFDNLIVDHVCDYLQKNYNYSPKSDQRNMRRINNQCEEAKKHLSIATESLIVLDGFLEGETISLELTREQFENMASKLFQKTIDIVDNCLKSCNVAKNQIKEIILSGGSTRIPKIQQMISSFFDDKTLNKIVNPDECVAEGAAIQAAMLSKNPKQKIDIMKITDVIPLSLGISNFVDLMTFFIKRNTSIPFKKTLSRITVDNLQRAMCFDVYEGERMDARKNHHLGTISISDITPAPPGQCEALFTMSVDENGILEVKAEEKFRNNVKNLTIVYTRGHRSDSEVKNALKDAEDNELEDERFVKFALLKEYVLDYCERAKYNFEEKKLKASHKEMYEMCKETKIEANAMDVGEEKKLEDLLEKVKQMCDGVVNKYGFKLMPIRRTAIR